MALIALLIAPAATISTGALLAAAPPPAGSSTPPAPVDTVAADAGVDSATGDSAAEADVVSPTGGAAAVASTDAGATPDARGSAPKPPTGASDSRRQAQALLVEGNRLVGQGEFVTALRRFRQAHEIFPSVKLLLNIGTTLRHLGRNAEAVDTYEGYLADPAAEPERKRELQRILRELRGLVATVDASVAPPDATLRVDGQRIDLQGDSASIYLDPGEHTVVLQRDGFAPVVRTLRTGPGQRIPLRIELVPTEERSPAPPPAPGPGAQRVVSYVVGATGVVALGAGGILRAVALSTDAEAEEHCLAATPTACDARGAELGQAAETQETASAVLLVGGGALLAAGVVLWLTSADHEGTPAAGQQDGTVALGVTGGPGVRLVIGW